MLYILAPSLLHQCGNQGDPMKVNLIPRKNLAILSAAFCTVMFAFSHNASATRHPLPPVTLGASIEGNINFAGAVHLDNNNLGLATTVVTWFDAFNNAGKTSVVPGATGNFSVIPAGTSATMAQPWVFNPSTPTPSLWSVGGFTFDLLSATVVSQSNTFLNVLGSGIVSGNGFDPTIATWSFTVNNSNGQPKMMFSFAANNNSVPDGGVTVALLGLALVGVEVLRRKLKAA
jgi:VPDSG-CTERM motif